MRNNHREIGKELYNILNEEDQAIVAFGMIPKDIMDMATKHYKLKTCWMK